MSAIQQKLTEYHQAVAAEKQAGQRVMAVLNELKKVAGGSTFDISGKYFQIRTRKGKTYLCELTGPPKGRPKKTEAEKQASAAAREAAKAAQPDADGQQEVDTPQ